MALDKGRGWHGDSEEHSKVGRKGGQARKRQINNDPDQSYENMGRKGGQASSGSFEEGSERAREAGRKGGKNSH